MKKYEVREDAESAWIEIDGEQLDIEDVVDSLNIYKQQLREKEARIARLEQACGLFKLSALNASSTSDIRRGIYDLNEAINESPQQSLACIQADAIDAMTKWMYSQAGTTVEDCPDMIDEYVAILRGKADEPTA